MAHRTKYEIQDFESWAWLMDFARRDGELHFTIQGWNDRTNFPDVYWFAKKQFKTHEHLIQIMFKRYNYRAYGSSRMMKLRLEEIFISAFWGGAFSKICWAQAKAITRQRVDNLLAETKERKAEANKS